MFLILQAFKPSSLQCPVLQSSSTRSSNVLLRILQYPNIRGNEISRSYRATPPSQKSAQASCTGSSLPPWGSIFSDPSRILCAGGPFSATPIAFCASECQKHMGKCSVAIFYAILPLMLAILPVLLAILAPTRPTSALKMPDKWHLGANIAKKVLQPPPQGTRKYQKTCVFHKLL